MNDGEEDALRQAFKANNWKGWEENELLFKNIIHREKDGMHLYNYGSPVLVERNHPVLMKCRGIVVDEKGKVLNYPFDRFFNDFEKEKCDIDWNTAEAQEKIDGSLISVFWGNDKWQITTRGSFYPNNQAEFDNWFLEQFHEFDLLEKDCCYMFELVSKNNRVVTWYKEEFIVLIGARYLTGSFKFKEFAHALLNAVAKELNVKRPKVYSISDLKGCKKLFDQLKEDDEGLVVVDENFNRIKLKQESYFKLSRIKMLKPEDLLDYVLGRTEIDQEYLAKIPEVIAEIEKIKETWDNYKNIVWATFEDIKPLAEKSRKDFALEANQHIYKAFLFQLLDGRTLNETVRWNQVKHLFEGETE